MKAIERKIQIPLRFPTEHNLNSIDNEYYIKYSGTF